MNKRKELAKGFSRVINSLSRENKSNTPDFILAEYLVSCLEAYEKLAKQHERYSSNVNS
jgi:hypothetical protein